MSTRLRRLLVGLTFTTLAVGSLYAFPPSFTYEPERWSAANRLAAHLPQPPGRGPLPAEGGDLLIVNAQLVDGTGAPTRGPVWIRVRHGFIEAIGDGAPPEAAAADPAPTTDPTLPPVPQPAPPVLDVEGRWVMAGLTDAHVHIGMAPASAVRMDPAEDTLRLLHHHLKAYLANGVTTILDPAVTAELGAYVLRRLAEGHPGPRYFHLGPVMANAGGYASEIFPPGLATAGDVEARLAEVADSGAIGIKVAFETGVILPDMWAAHPPELLDAIQAGATRRSLPIYAHCMNDLQCQAALAVHPRALVHTPDTASPDLVAALTTQKPYVVTTMARWDMSRLAVTPEQMDAPLWRLTVPEEARRAVWDEAEATKANVGLTAWTLPGLPGPLVTLLGHLASTPWALRQTHTWMAPKLAELQATVKRLYDAGLPIVLGTDAGNHPIIPMYLHGVLTQREVELLAGAGLPPEAVLRAATLEGARLVGRERELGTVEVAKRADLIVLDQDPRVDLAAALKTLRWTVFDGVANTPEGWMAL